MSTRDRAEGPGPGQLLFTFVRHWARRAATGDPETAVQGRLVQVTEAVYALTERGASATVNAVADDLGIDQSGASRLLRDATEAGYLTLTSSPTDARQRRATVTTAGRTLLRDAHRWQEQVFDELTTGWNRRRREEFQRAMADLIAQDRNCPERAGESSP